MSRARFPASQPRQIGKSGSQPTCDFILNAHWIISVLTASCSAAIGRWQRSRPVTVAGSKPFGILFPTRPRPTGPNYFKPTQKGFIVFSLKDKTALVTGAASGIGAATAQIFAEAGAMVWLADRNETEGKATANRIGGNFVSLDVTNEAACQQAAQ